ncbi:MAG: beta-carotene hydroxylase, partial [Alphaproteobacteria bacterium]|nr:beta-carotene hydroxylase [Alphaproteobacteria bacterium]
MSAVDLRTLSQAELVQREREIAARHIDKFPWLAVTWAFTNFAVWLSLWPLVMTGTLPLWVAFPLATLNIMLSY